MKNEDKKDEDMIEKEDIKKRNEIEEDNLPDDLPERTLASVNRRAKALYSKIRVAGEMNPEISFKAFEVARDMKSVVASLGLKAEFKEIEISKNLDETLDSINQFVTSCSNALNDIKSAKMEAFDSLHDLADAVEASKNPNEDKINAHITNIVNKMTYKIFK